jgi:hypothetical protein
MWWAAAAAGMILCVGAGYSLNAGSRPLVASHVEAQLRKVIGRVVVTAPSGDSQIVTSAARVAAGEEISTTAEGFASVELGDQTLVDLSGATTLKLDQIHRHQNSMFLRSGRVDLNVPRGDGQARLVRVSTPDASVSVLGTIFSVEVTERDEQSFTTVRVSRGSVAVTHGGLEHLLKSGEQWSSLPSAAQVVRSPPAPSESRTGSSELLQSGDASEQARPSGSLPSTRTSVSAEKPAPPRVEPSNLAQQNELFERGLSARDRGDDEQAIRWFDRLTQEFPSSPLLPSARLEMQLAKKRLSAATP